jgi:integrase
MKLVKRGNVWWIIGHIKGQPYRKSTGESDYGKADAKLEEKLADFGLTKDKKNKNGGITYIAASEEYQSRPKPIGDWARVALPKLENEFSGLTIEQMTTSRIGDWTKRIKGNNNTKRKYLGLLKAVLNHARKAALTTYFPYIEMPMELAGRTRRLSKAEKVQLIDAASGDLAFLRPLVRFMFRCGVGTGNALDMQWSQVDLDERFVTIERFKGGKHIVREVPLPDDVHADLTALPNKVGYVFLDGDGQPMATKIKGNKYYRGYKLLRQLTDKSKLRDFKPYDLRHTFGSDADDAEIDVLTLADLMGHASLATTRRYIHKSRKRKRKAMEKMG